MKKIKPCPECGSDNLNIMTEHTSGNRVIHCTSCHKYYDKLELTREDTPSDIFEKWNEYAQNYKPEPKTESALKPCPFCGKSAVKMVCHKNPDNYDGAEFWVSCTKCHIKTNRFLNEDEPVELWNRRVGE